ncbi:FAD-dependent monooxygenase [Labedaea rhizosphaerae]|uniref:2-polyprenyl-6-methoxyphenol hydroxylase-like FAD-dependent oxidoreductase n=1 Tax=Labedaea rhizosphaerae TaxID=598644 RepID=A0A4R6SC45_LABRH|nr:FAD-dependent monooxygenase [Labedaea rhizosphaerae]TDP97530.1 2-polyprenyl-6-methoxyphenol hydroxylase-like FAD-dependent oxidoreductase [Labedaea rhizosphaerae]
MRTDTTSVLVVGGGLTGLSTALFLAWRDVPVIVVERHPGSSPHPRAVGFTPRTMELMRAVGLSGSLPEYKGDGKGVRRIRVESLAGQWFEEQPWSAPGKATPLFDYTPTRNGGLAQDRFEPLLRDKARELGADVRMSTRMLGFEQDDDGVTATMRDDEGVEYQVRASYLVAADGHRSPVREALGIERVGKGFLGESRSVLFRAPLEEYLERGYVQFMIDQGDFGGAVMSYGDGRWAFFHRNEVDSDEDTLRAMIFRALGRSDVDVEIITEGRWQLTAGVAERFADGRVFLAGDAAHTLPPSRGGFGANTGIEDAHNLAWKLAAVLTGASAPSLLATYDAERRPVAKLRHDQIFLRTQGAATDVETIDDAAMEYGHLYRSSAVLGAGPELPPARRPDQWLGQPGTRAPHVWLAPEVSTLDLFQRGWVLVTDDPAWDGLVDGVDCRVIGNETGKADEVRAAFGLNPGGASLVRPDGYIAWRAVDAPADRRAALGSALAEVSAAPALATS